VLRIFKIWEERDVYTNTFVDELSMLLDSPLKTETKPTVKLNTDFEVNHFSILERTKFNYFVFYFFQSNHLVDKIHQCRALEEDTDLKQRTLTESKVCSIINNVYTINMIFQRKNYF
jgi:hypothetical protein